MRSPVNFAMILTVATQFSVASYAMTSEDLVTSITPSVLQTRDLNTKLPQVKEQIRKAVSDEDALKGGRRFLSRKSDQEKADIANVKGLQSQVDGINDLLSKANLRINDQIKAYLRETNEDYKQVAELLDATTPIDQLGQSSVSQLKSAEALVHSAKTTAKINTGGAAVGLLLGGPKEPPTLTGALLESANQGASQHEVSSALKAANEALSTSAKFALEVNGVVRARMPQASGIFSGTTNGILERGFVASLWSNQNPFSSDSFNFSTGLFQLNDLSRANANLIDASQSVQPLEDQVHAEVLSLEAKANAIEKQKRAELEALVK